MARENLSIITGFVTSVEVSSDGKKAFAHVSIVRGERPVGDGFVGHAWTSILVGSMDPEVVAIMREWTPTGVPKTEEERKEALRLAGVGKNEESMAYQRALINIQGGTDIVLVKGHFVTTTIEKGISMCPNEDCESRALGVPLTRPGQASYIRPVNKTSLLTLRHVDTVAEAEKFVMEHNELSNIIKVSGTIASNIIKRKTSSGIDIYQFQMAIGRKIHIDDNRTDFPWVNMAGETGAQAKKRTRVGSLIMVDGFVQKRFFLVGSQKCPFCGTPFRYRDSRMELVPYENGIEYLANCLTEEEAMEEERKRDEGVLNSILAGMSANVSSQQDDVPSQQDYDNGYDDGDWV